MNSEGKGISGDLIMSQKENSAEDKYKSAIITFAKYTIRDSSFFEKSFEEQKKIAETFLKNTENKEA